VRRRLAAGALLLVLLAVFSGCCTVIPVAPDYVAYAPTLAPPLTRSAPNVGTSVGYLAPDFTLTDVDGQQVTLSQFRGKEVLLNFWTYCDACKAELPYIQKVYDGRDATDPDLVVLALNVTQPADQVQEFVDYYGFTFPFLLDTWGTVASSYYVHDIPTTFFIDRNGVIADIFAGEFSGPGPITDKVLALKAR
jgi:peroxiredoxin